jgi:tRNA threonylcarbamoyladenosine modification (KEOPS) complex Cgi121 subunit
VLKRIEEFAVHVEITGFKNANIPNSQKFLTQVNKEKPKGVDTQFFDARLVATWHHLYFAVLDALTAFANEENISKSVAMETLLYASAERQIIKATERMGIKQGMSDVAVLIIGEEPNQLQAALSAISRIVGGRLDEKVLELSKSKMEMIRESFNIGETELGASAQDGDADGALVDAIIERMALLVTER